MLENEKSEEFEIAIRESRLQLVLQALADKGIELSSSGSIPQRPTTGEMYQMQGYQVGPAPNGDVRLTLHIELGTGGRSMPINLSPKQAADLADMLLTQASPLNPS